MSFPYPPKPWSDGDQVQQLQDDGTVITATYKLSDNVWNMVRTNPDSELAYVTDQQVFITNDGDGVAPVLKLLDPLEDPVSETTLYDRNKKANDLSRKTIRQIYRVNDGVDFINNTVSSGLWVHTLAEQAASLPGPTEFFLFDENDNNTTQFDEVKKIIFAGEGTGALNSNANLKDTRVGDNLLIQENDENHFGYYVVDEIEVVGQPDLGGLWFIQMIVRVASDRAFGDSAEFSHCSVKVVRPVFVQNNVNPPILSENGQLWYNPISNTLSVWDNDQGKFYPIGGEGGDETVIVGPNPPLDPYEGQLWFDTVRLELYIRYLEDQDGEERGTWLPTSPLGARVAAGEALQAEIVTRVGNLEAAVDDGVREQTSLRSRIGDTEVALDGKLSTTGNNKVTSDSNKEWRVQGASKTYIKVDENANTVGLFNLQPATEDHHAISRGWAKDNTVQLSGDNHVANDWKIQCNDKTHFHVKGGTSRIYYLQDPSHPQHPVNLQYADANYVKKSESAATDMTWKWHHPAQNTVGKGSIYFVTNEIGSVTTIRIATESLDGRKVNINNFSYKAWNLPFTIYTEDENGIKIIAAGVSSHAECKTFSNVQTISIEFTNSSDMMNWRRDSVPTETPVKVKIAGLLP